MPLLFEAFIYLLIGAVSASLTTDYYQKLISQETAKSLTYELPKKNEEFRSGFESNEINGRKQSQFATILLFVFRLWYIRRGHSRSGNSWVYSSY